MKSLNVIFPEKNKVELWEEVVNSPAPGEVLCAAEKSLISTGTEMLCLRGVFDPGTNWEGWVKYPFHAGYSMAARVVSVGMDVKSVKEGDRVAVNYPHKQLFTVSHEDVQLLPEGITYEDAAWVPLAITAQQGIRRAELKLGETVGVVGLGMIGQLVVQYLKLMGARKIIAIDTAPMRLDLARELGATHTIVADVKSARKSIEEITEGRMLDAVFDVTGHPSVLAHAIQLLRKFGRVILLGDTATPTLQCLGPGVVSNSISILGIHMTMSPKEVSEFNPWTSKEMTALFFDYILQRRMRIDKLISHRYSPAEAEKAYEELSNNCSNVMGVIFDWNSLSLT